MTAKSADDILGLEFDWIASDADGHVARFSPAGGGMPPWSCCETQTPMTPPSPRS